MLGAWGEPVMIRPGVCTWLDSADLGRKVIGMWRVAQKTIDNRQYGERQKTVDARNMGSNMTYETSACHNHLPPR